MNSKYKCTVKVSKVMQAPTFHKNIYVPKGWKIYWWWSQFCVSYAFKDARECSLKTISVQEIIIIYKWGLWKDREEKISIIFTLDESCRFGQQWSIGNWRSNSATHSASCLGICSHFLPQRPQYDTTYAEWDGHHHEMWGPDPESVQAVSWCDHRIFFKAHDIFFDSVLWQWSSFFSSWKYMTIYIYPHKRETESPISQEKQTWLVQTVDQIKWGPGSKWAQIWDNKFCQWIWLHYTWV